MEGPLQVEPVEIALPPVAPRRSRQLTVFLSDETLRMIEALAAARGQRAGKVASLIIESAAPRLHENLREVS